MSAERKEREPLTFDEVQAITGKWPRVAGLLGPRLQEVPTGYLGPEGDGSKLDSMRRWRKDLLNELDGSMKLCEGCVGLPECKQIDGFPGSSTTGVVHVPMVDFAGNIQRAVRYCKFEKMRQEANQRPWMEKRHAEFTFKGFIVTDANRAAFTACRKYVRNLQEEIQAGKGLVLSGSTGVGKTHLASAIFSQAAQQGIMGSFCVVPALLDEVRRRYGDKEGGLTKPDAAAYMSAVTGAPLLVLDNMEIRNVTPWVVDTLFSIVDHRYRNLMPTLVTTGWTAEQMSEALEEKVPSRLLHSCEWYHVNEVDWRRETAKGTTRRGGRKS